MQREREPAAATPSVLARVLMAAVHCYRAVLAPLLPSSCRFEPSCSTYALQVLARYGAFCGTVLAARRLSRCRPTGPRGLDPVPDPAPQRAPVPYGLLRPARQRRRITL
ncbi:hypothetical protein A4R43_21690 [Amycolatopsis albispora]|uniref:Putative membrane protein insertion efficiency factor n=2 Tax=Amycolatopsis albispora TaxID=1804986 RepID=A0A344LKX7_9PSEU|nr:hypothetical protein A4R43_21690 [Amycolatopsis albispora]